jgi:hypothetical protein
MSAMLPEVRKCHLRNMGDGQLWMPVLLINVVGSEDTKLKEKREPKYKKTHRMN